MCVRVDLCVYVYQPLARAFAAVHEQRQNILVVHAVAEGHSGHVIEEVRN